MHNATSIPESAEGADAVGDLIASQQLTVVGFTERVRCTVALGTLLIFDGTIWGNVVTLAEADVSSGVVDQRLTKSIGRTWLR